MQTVSNIREVSKVYVYTGKSRLSRFGVPVSYIMGTRYGGGPLTHPARYLYSIDGFGAAGTPVK